jgi:hypothetical protein
MVMNFSKVDTDKGLLLQIVSAWCVISQMGTSLPTACPVLDH